MSVINIASYEELLNAFHNTNKMVVLCAGAESWCVPCQRLAPHYEALSSQIDDEKVMLLKVDIDEAPDVAEELGIMGVPAILAFKENGQWFSDVKGRTVVKLKSEIESLLQTS